MSDSSKAYELFLITTRLASRAREPEKWALADARRAMELQVIVGRIYGELGWVMASEEGEEKHEIRSSKSETNNPKHELRNPKQPEPDSKGAIRNSWLVWGRDAEEAQRLIAFTPRIR